MGFLKGLAVWFLGFLLFLSLSVFALLFTLNSTILSPDFVVSELDRLDIASLVEEVEELLGEQIPQEEIPEELRVAVVDTITKLEPLVKEQVGAAIYPVHDYLLGESESLDLALVLGDTFLNPDFVVSLVDELDMPLLAEEFLAGGFLTEQITEEIPEEMEYLVEYVDEAITELELWVKGQVSIAAAPVFDYLLGKSQSLNVVISLEPMMESLRDTLRGAFLESPPPDLAHLPPAELEQHFDEFFGELAEEMPSTFEIDESLLGTEIPAQMAEALAVVEEALAEARPYIGYFQLGYKAVIGFILLLILGIVVINRQIRGATRKLGSVFLTFAVPAYISLFAVKYFDVIQAWILQRLNIDIDIPAQLQALILQSANNFLAPVRMFCLTLLIGGIVLLIVSFVYKPRQP